ncbi:MAG: hypothetical protein A2X66_05685 [Ignavibacteria bacterium GWA2_54_16]|nr:MAG: hypothetical protein A2X66_05685 [Ignavibacteria bacterium GWA2_54_16]
MTTCPKCGNEQPDVFSQCQKCRFIFPSSPANQTKRFARSATSSASGPLAHPAVVILGALFVSILLGFALWWLNSPEGLPPLEGSYENAANRFSMLAPPDWVVLTSENYQELFDKMGSRFPKMLRDGFSAQQTEVGFIKVLENADFSPSVNVVVMKTEMPELNEEQLAEGAKVLSEGFRRMLDNYRMERSELITIDELTSAQFTSRGSLKMRVERAGTEGSSGGSGSSELRSFEMQFAQTLVPGKGRAYIITSSALIDQYPEYRKRFDGILDSFRVLQRPSRFGSITMGALNGGLASAMAYLLFTVLMQIVGLFKNEEPLPAPPPL